MEQISKGYVFTEAELLVAFGSMGVENVYGLPLRGREIGEEEEMRAVRRLLSNGVARYENGVYALEKPFAGAFKDMKKASGSLSLVSKNRPLGAYVCFPGARTIVWEISGYMRDRFTLLLFDRAEEFCELLVKEDFFPELGSYLERVPESLGERLAGAIESAAVYGDLSGADVAVLVKRTAEDGVSYVAAGSEDCGSYIARLKDGASAVEEYRLEKLVAYIRENLKESESNEGN